VEDCGQTVRARDILQMRTSKLFVAKKVTLFENYSVSALTREEGTEAVRASGETGQFFVILCGCFLWTDPK